MADEKEGHGKGSQRRIETGNGSVHRKTEISPFLLGGNRGPKKRIWKVSGNRLGPHNVHVCKGGGGERERRFSLKIWGKEMVYKR